jgi:hypothetical protein
MTLLSATGDGGEVAIVVDLYERSVQGNELWNENLGGKLP